MPRLRLRVLLLGCALAIPLASASAARRATRVGREAAPPPIVLSLRAAGPLVSGSPFLVEVRSGEPVASCALRSGGRDVPLRAVSAVAFKGVAGVDLEAEPGSLALEATCVPMAGGEEIRAARTLRIGKAAFRTERLRVAGEYVKPPPGTEARIADEKARMEAAVALVSPLPQGGIRLALPLRAPSRNFGVRRVFNGVARAPHAGSDFLAGRGTAVAAAGEGRVAIAASLYFAGNTVLLDHGGGVYTLYAHLDRIDVAEGERVERGARIGLVGATGRVTGPHLHFAARVLGARVDPMALAKLLGG